MGGIKERVRKKEGQERTPLLRIAPAYEYTTRMTTSPTQTNRGFRVVAFPHKVRSMPPPVRRGQSHHDIVIT